MQPYAQKIADNRSARVRLVGLPHDKNSSFLRGSADGPAAIRRALFSDSANLFTENGHDLSSRDLIMDAGDVVFDGADDFEAIVAAAAAAADGGLPIFLGGDHFVTWPAVRGIAAACPGLTILHFDAHPDTYDEFAGSRILPRLPLCPYHGGRARGPPRLRRYTDDDRAPGGAGRPLRDRGLYDEGLRGAAPPRPLRPALRLV